MCCKMTTVYGPARSGAAARDVANLIASNEIASVSSRGLSAQLLRRPSAMASQ